MVQWQSSTHKAVRVTYSVIHRYSDKRGRVVEWLSMVSMDTVIVTWILGRVVRW